VLDLAALLPPLRDGLRTAFCEAILPQIGGRAPSSADSASVAKLCALLLASVAAVLDAGGGADDARDAVRRTTRSLACPIGLVREARSMGLRGIGTMNNDERFESAIAVWLGACDYAEKDARKLLSCTACSSPIDISDYGGS